MYTYQDIQKSIQERLRKKVEQEAMAPTSSSHFDVTNIPLPPIHSDLATQYSVEMLKAAASYQTPIPNELIRLRCILKCMRMESGTRVVEISVKGHLNNGSLYDLLNRIINVVVDFELVLEETTNHILYIKDAYLDEFLPTPFGPHSAACRIRICPQDGEHPKPPVETVLPMDGNPAEFLPNFPKIPAAGANNLAENNSFPTQGDDEMKRTEIARRACETLESKQFWWTTSSLLAELDLPNSSRPGFLPVLHALVEAGVIERRGSGKYRWRLLTKDWNRTNPLKGVQVKSSAEVVDKIGELAAKGDQLATTAEAVAHAGQLQLRIRSLEEKVKELQDRPQSTLKIEVQRYDDPEPVELDDMVVPPYFETIMDLASCQVNILLVGPTGCGKTHLGSMVSKVLDRRFGSISCTAGMMESHLLGRNIPDIQTGEGRFQTTDFLRCYEEGGVFLADEIDAADSNLLLALNNALANESTSVPNRPDEPQAFKHPDFVFIATANTYGRGADRLYAGRNQLDEATLSRFRIGTVECDYDKGVEAALCPNDEIRNACQAIRTRIEAAGLRRVMDTRFIKDAYKMHVNRKWTLKRILDTYFQGWSREERAKVWSG